MLADESLGCPTCKVALDERELVCSSLTIEKCPRCGTTVRKSDGISGTNFAALIAGNVAAIDTWLDNYATETTHRVVKRPIRDNRSFLWAMETPFGFACECHFDQKRPYIVSLRLASKHGAGIINKNPARLVAAAARFGLQPYGVRQTSMNIENGTTIDEVWGMVQYLDINTLTTSLLTNVADRINTAMQHAATELLGDAGA